MKPMVNRIVGSFETKRITDFLEQNRGAVIVALMSILLIDTFFVKLSSDAITFGVLLSYIALSRVYRWTSRITYLICIGLLIAMFISFIFSYTSIATEKLAVWLFLFLLIGIIKAWKE